MFAKIHKVPLRATHNMQSKFELNQKYRLDIIIFSRIHSYISVKIAWMNSGHHKLFKYVKTSKSRFFMITMLSLHSICYKSTKKGLEPNKYSIYRVSH